MKKIQDIQLGEFAQDVTVIDEAKVKMMAEVTGDHNPVHLDEAYAKETIFGQKIAHGVFCNALVSKVLGTQLPGPGTIYLSQNIDYRSPIFLGDTITTSVIVNDKNEKSGRIDLDVHCVNQRNEAVASGMAVVLLR